MPGTVSWLRLDEDVLDDPRVAAATVEQGPIGIAAWIFALTTAKRQNRKGDVELSPIVMARTLGITTEQASAAIGSMVTLGLVASNPTKQNLYAIPSWEKYQPDSRPDSYTRREMKALGKPVSRTPPGESQGEPGRTGVTGRDVTGRDGSFLKKI